MIEQTEERLAKIKLATTLMNNLLSSNLVKKPADAIEICNIILSLLKLVNEERMEGDKK